MLPTEPLPLHHSWPLFEAGLRLEQGLVHDPAAGPACWLPSSPMFQCDLPSGRLDWASPVFALFGMPPGQEPDRAATLAIYDEPSRSAVERLRAHAIRHRRGFTIDARLCPPGQAPRWIRIVAQPRLSDGRPVVLEGWKRDVSDEYR